MADRDALAYRLRAALSDAEQRGRAVFLIGGSSAGKTSIGRALVELLPDGYLFFESDRFGVSSPRARPDLLTLEREYAVTRGHGDGHPWLSGCTAHR